MSSLKKEQERRLLRCIGWIDNELILEADQARFRSRNWVHWTALAACLALVVSAPFWLSKHGLQPGNSTQPGNSGESAAADPAQPAKDEALAQGGEENQSESPVPDLTYGKAEILKTESIGGMYLGMSTATLGEPDAISNSGPVTYPDGSTRISWFYDSGTAPDGSYDLTLSLADTGDGWFLNEIFLRGDSDLTLSTGIGIGSTAAEIEAAYPSAVRVQEEAIENDQVLHYNIYTIDEGLTIQTSDDICSSIVLGPWLQTPAEEFWETEPLPYDLTSNEITIYQWNGGVWEATTVIDRAAKGICTVLTISEPEEAYGEKEGVSAWMDFGNGTAVELLGGDRASIWTYESDTFDPDKTDGLTWHFGGIFLDLDDYVAQALENPTETWVIADNTGVVSHADERAEAEEPSAP